MKCPKCDNKMIYTKSKTYYCEKCDSYDLGEYEKDDKTVISKGHNVLTSFMGYKPGVFYCYNNNLKGYLCLQCTDKEECDKEQRHFQKMLSELKDFAKEFKSIYN